MRIPPIETLHHDPDGKKYMLGEMTRYPIELPLAGGEGTPFINYDAAGRNLIIRAGYKWDGASGPAPDTSSALVASLVHDALYELLRKGILPKEWRRRADIHFMIALCLYGMGPFRAVGWYGVLRLFGARAARRRLTKRHWRG